MNCSGDALSSRCASRVSSLPLVSSSPIDSRPTRGRLDAERDPRVHAAHDGELQQMLRPALDAGADVEQHRRLPCVVGIVAASAGRSTPGSMPNAPCAAMTVAPVWPALNSAAASPRATQLGRDPDRRRRLAPQRRRGDSAISITASASTIRTRSAIDQPACRSTSASTRVRPDQHHAQVEVPRRRERAVDDSAGRGVAAHGVDGDPDPSGCECWVRGATRALPVAQLLLVDRARLAAAVVPAVGAHAVRRLGFVALRALAEAHRLQRVVRPALGRAGLGVSSFWIRHRLKILSSPRSALSAASRGSSH